MRPAAGFRRRVARVLWMASAALAMGLALTGCELLYDSRLGDALRDCEKRVMQTEVTACKQKLQDQVAAAKRGQDTKAVVDVKPAAKSDGCYTRQATGERICPN